MSASNSFMKTALKTSPATKTETARQPPASGMLPIIHIVPQSHVSQTVLALIGRARARVPKAEVRHVSRPLELTVRELAPILDTTERTLARRLEGAGELGKSESERLLLLRQLAAHGVDVFEDQGKFNRWLRRPLSLLGNQSPLDLLDTASGFQVVDELLGRIEYGVYS
jgi:putative toxin-antitoxin system antitoxin component (TIGR02293 family)